MEPISAKVWKAYIILAHKNSDQVHRLLKTLDDGTSQFFIHVDKNTRIEPFLGLAAYGNKIEFVPRVKASWGSFNLVEAVLNGMKAVQSFPRKIDQVILLSGQDYPIKPNAFINEFICNNSDTSFLEHFTIPNHSKWNPDGGEYRVTKYFLGLKFHQRYLAKSLNFLSLFVPAVRRKIYNKMQPFGGSMWWNISKSALDYILSFVEKNPGYVNYQRFTFAPDEVFFQTILLNCKDEQIAGAIVNDNKRFIKWKNKDAAHPETLNAQSLSDLIHSESLFARKFDSTQDPEILDLIDKHCLS